MQEQSTLEANKALVRRWFEEVWNKGRAAMTISKPVQLNSVRHIFIQLRASGIVIPMEQKELKSIIHSDPEIMGGTPVFLGTRVPLQNLIDSLEGDQSIEEFLTAFPTVRREQVIAVIEAGKLKMLETV